MFGTTDQLLRAELNLFILYIEEAADDLNSFISL